MNNPTLLALTAARREMEKIESPGIEVETALGAIERAASVEVSLECRLGQAASAAASTNGEARTVDDGKTPVVPIALHGLYLVGLVFPVPAHAEPP